jgi:excisionase family DNA binding protein
MAAQASGRTNRSPAQLLTVLAAAERLGCSDMHIYRLVSTGELCAVDISLKGAGKSKTRIRSDDLDAYIESRTRRAGEPVVETHGTVPDATAARTPQPPPKRRSTLSRRSSRPRQVRAEAGLGPSPAV